MDKINEKLYEINRLLETKGLPFDIELKDFTFKEAEEIKYRLMERNFRVNIYEEFKVLHLGIYKKN